MVLAPERVLEGQPALLRPARPDGLEWCLRWWLAACSLGAATIHFAYSPSHLAQYWLYGLFFVALGWFQLLWALGILLRFGSRMLMAGVVASTAVMVVWVLSRTVGVGVGPDASVTEAATFPDMLATFLEAIIVVAALLWLVRPPSLPRRFRVRWLTPVAASGALILVASSTGYALAPRFTAAHSHSTTGLTGNTPCEKAGPPASQGQVFDSAGHFHRGPTVQQPIDGPARLELQTQQEQARAVAAKYPTVADAANAGYRESTVYVPCIGAHYTNAALAIRFDPSLPSELLYAGTAPDARIVGLSYLVIHAGGPPEGFTGPNDVWHQHSFNGGLCINASGLVIGAERTSPAQCVAMGGRKVPLTNVWMLHDWVVPGFECSWGVFASECPELGGRLGGTPWDAPDPNSPPLPQG
jgi:hypothetical protein